MSEPRRGKPRLYTSFSAAGEAVPFPFLDYATRFSRVVRSSGKRNE